MAGLRQRFRRRGQKTRLTREGRYFIALSIGVGLAAINTGNNLLYLLLGWLLSLIIASGVLSTQTLRGLRIRRRAPARLHAGRPFALEIEVENTKRTTTSYSVAVEDRVDDRPLDKRCYFLKLPPGRAQRSSYRHTFARRGVHRLSGFSVSTRFPFSLFEKSAQVTAELELLVYPPVRPVPLPAPRARRQGEIRTASLGRRGEFFGLREYREGDDRRSIHWRSTARSGRLLVREMEDESLRRATIVVDNALPADADEAQEEALEAAVALAASLSDGYARRGYALRLIARGALVPFGLGAGHTERILKALALLETAAPETPFAASVDPRTESVLVVPRGVGSASRPAGAAHVLEAG